MSDSLNISYATPEIVIAEERCADYWRHLKKVGYWEKNVTKLVILFYCVYTPRTMHKARQIRIAWMVIKIFGSVLYHLVLLPVDGSSRACGVFSIILRISHLPTFLLCYTEMKGSQTSTILLFTDCQWYYRSSQKCVRHNRSCTLSIGIALW